MRWEDGGKDIRTGRRSQSERWQITAIRREGGESKNDITRDKQQQCICLWINTTWTTCSRYLAFFSPFVLAALVKFIESASWMVSAFELHKWTGMATVCHDDDAKKKKNHCSAQSVIFGMVFSWAYLRQYDLLSCFSWLSGWVGGACVCTIWLCLCFNRKLSEKMMTLLDDWLVLIRDVWGCKGQYMLSKCGFFAISDTNAMREADFGKTKWSFCVVYYSTQPVCYAA